MDLDDYYTGIAGRFDELRLDREGEIRLTLRHLPELDSQSTVLDIGSGTGRYARALQQRGARVVAVDKNFSQLQYAPLSMLRVRALGQALPFRDSVFSGSLMVLVLHQVPREERLSFLAEGGRVLERGGLLAIKTSSHSDLHMRTVLKFFPAGLAINLARYPDIDELLELATVAGYSHLDTIRTHSVQTLTTERLMRSVRGRHNTMLALISDADFERGCIELESSFKDMKHVQVGHFHTIVKLIR